MKGDRYAVLAGAVVTAAVFWAAGDRGWAFSALAVGLFFVGRGARANRAFTTDQRRQLLDRDGVWCAYRTKGDPCWFRPVHYASDCPLGGCDLDYEADHVEPWSTGGDTTLNNGVVACRRHNRWKGARPLVEFLEDPDGDGVPGVG